MSQPANGRPSTHPICLAGTPAATAPSGTERVTTAFAPTTAFRPIVTPLRTTAFCPSHAKSPISTGATTSGWRARCSSGAVPWSWSRIATFEPRRTPSPIVTDSAAAMLTYPSTWTSSPIRILPGAAPACARTASRRTCARMNAFRPISTLPGSVSASNGPRIVAPGPSAPSDRATRRFHAA